MPRPKQTKYALRDAGGNYYKRPRSKREWSTTSKPLAEAMAVVAEGETGNKYTLVLH